jgi:hypothetical protein
MWEVKYFYNEFFIVREFYKNKSDAKKMYIQKKIRCKEIYLKEVKILSK